MKIAGIDVHKKVLMVVIVNGSAPEEKPTRRRFATMPSQLHQLLIWLQGQGGRRSGDGIDCPVLAVGVAGTGAAYAFAPGAGVFQSCAARAQA